MAGLEIRKNWYNTNLQPDMVMIPKKLTFQNLIFKDEAQANDWNLKTKSYKGKRFCFFLFANGSYLLMNRIHWGEVCAWMVLIYSSR